MAAQTGNIKGPVFTDEKNIDPVSNGLVRFQKFPPSLSSGFKRRFEPETNLPDPCRWLMTHLDDRAHSDKARGLNNGGLGFRLDLQDASATYRVRDARSVRRRVNDRDGGGATRVFPSVGKRPKNFPRAPRSHPRHPRR